MTRNTWRCSSGDLYACNYRPHYIVCALHKTALMKHARLITVLMG